MERGKPMNTALRWKQRFTNYNKALSKLTKAIAFIKSSQGEHLKPETGYEVIDEMIKEALIQRFEYTHELAWNVMKDFALYQGNSNVGGSRDAIREAFQLNLISNANVWMDMISSRNVSTHTYNEATANSIYEKILNLYYPEFLDFQSVMNGKINES